MAAYRSAPQRGGRDSVATVLRDHLPADRGGALPFPDPAPVISPTAMSAANVAVRSWRE